MARPNAWPWLQGTRGVLVLPPATVGGSTPPVPVGTFTGTSMQAQRLAQVLLQSRGMQALLHAKSCRRYERETFLVSSTPGLLLVEVLGMLTAALALVCVGNELGLLALLARDPLCLEPKAGERTYRFACRYFQFPQLRVSS